MTCPLSKRAGRSKTLGAVLAWCCISSGSLAHAAGLGNLTYTATELDKPIANFGGEGASKWPTGPTGSNTAILLRDTFIVMGSKDSGAPPGSFHFYDLKDPRAPRLLNTLDGTPETSQLRELHAMPVAIIDGRDFLVFPTTGGLQFFDFTDPMKPTASGSIALSGLKGGDYDNTVWMLSWAWPYVYAGGTGNGVFVVDATDPAHPTQVTKIASGELGNFRVGPTYAAGNYLVVANMDQTTTHFSVLDVGDPKSPFLLATGSTPASLYSSLVVGDRIYGAGTNGDYVAMQWTPTAVTPASTMKSGADRGGYCTFQSSFLICGQSSEGFKKWDMHDEAAPQLVGHGTDPAGVGGDFDFATIMGNLVYLGNDHGTGAALIPHATAPDTIAPEVLKVFPSNGDTNQPLTTRITVFFSEDIDLASLSPTNLLVRENGGAALTSVFSRSSFDAISIGFREPLKPNTTYEIVIPAGGLTDLVGNPIAEPPIVRFSTGATVAGGGSGAGGAGGAGGGSPLPQGGDAGNAGNAGTLASAGSEALAGSGGSDALGGSPTGGGGGMATGLRAAPPASPTGCACSLPARSSRGGGFALLPLLGLWLSARRRARRSGSRTLPA